MTTLADHARLLPRTPPTGREAGRIRFPARHSPESWPATCQTRDAVWDRLTRAPFVVDNAHTQKIRLRGLTFLLDWLEDQPGRTWQERWLASGADAAGAGWRTSPARWLQQHGLVADWRLDALASALLVAISADLVRPALGWLVAKATGPGSLVRHLAHARDPDGFARLKALCDADPHVSSVANSHTLHRAAEILATKGGRAGRRHRRGCPGVAGRRTRHAGIGARGRRGVLSASAHHGRLRPGRADHAAGDTGQRWAAHTRGTHRPIPLVLPSGPRPAGGLSARTPAIAGLLQHGKPRLRVGGAVLAGPGDPPSRHRRPAPARRGRRRLETTAAHQTEDDFGQTLGRRSPSTSHG